MISIERGGGKTVGVDRGKTRWLMTDDYRVKCRNLIEIVTNWKNQGGAYPKIYHGLIRFRRDLRTRVNIVYKYRFSDTTRVRRIKRDLNVSHNIQLKSQRRDERRPTCGGYKKSAEIRWIGLRVKADIQRGRLAVRSLYRPRCWLSSRWTSRPTLICTLEIEFSPFSHRVPIPPIFLAFSASSKLGFSLREERRCGEIRNMDLRTLGDIDGYEHSYGGKHLPLAECRRVTRWGNVAGNVRLYIHPWCSESCRSGCFSHSGQS